MALTNIEQPVPETVYSARPEWLKAARLKAWEQYMELPVPGKSDPLWKHTSPEQFLYKPNGKQHNAEPYEIGDIAFQKKLEQDFVSGRIGGIVTNRLGQRVSALLPPKLRNSGVIVGDLAEFARTRPKLIEPYFGKMVGGDFGKFESLNFAQWENGIILYVPKGVVIEKPIYLITHVPASGRLTARNLIIVDENALVNVFEILLGGSGVHNGGAVNLVTESWTERASNLKHVMANNVSTGTVVHFTHRSYVGGDAQNLTVFATLGGGVSKNNVGTILGGQGAENILKGFVAAGKRQHADHFSLQDHRAGNTHSSLDFKTVVAGRARTAFRGRISIDKHAPYSEAYQQNKNMILSSKARAVSIPELEIRQDEVRCSHGATVGPPDENQLFYLKSRGIPEDQALKLVVSGFMEESLRKLPDPLSDRLKNMIDQKLEEN